MIIEPSHGDSGKPEFKTTSHSIPSYAGLQVDVVNMCFIRPFKIEL